MYSQIRLDSNDAKNTASALSHESIRIWLYISVHASFLEAAIIGAGIIRIGVEKAKI